ncbi:cytochrome P450 [Cadophora sp. MPI-SDFR-AT-0126]|nr:cytochrome P450 [Leotiomycetes sp. MPI-SDFR-AT-0126]
MNTYVSLLLWLAAAELLRRLVLALKLAFTGPLSKIPGPKLWSMTSLPWMIENITGNCMNTLPGLLDKYGDVVRVGPKDILIRDKAAVQKILVEDDLVKSPIYEAIRPDHHITSLITETDKVAYKKKRRLLSPGFSISYLNALEPIVKECVKVFEEWLDNECSKGKGYTVVDMSNMMGNLSFDIMSATSFGGSFNLVASNDKKLKNLFHDRLKRAAVDAQFPFIKYLPFVPPSQSEEFNNMIDGIISKRRAEKGPVKRDLVQIFLESHEEDPVAFTHQHIREEMALFMIAGSDTSAVTLTHTYLLLLNNPEKLKKLIAEIDTAFPSKHDSITFANTQELPYLNACINESMRVLPILVVGLARYTQETTILANYEIPPETIVSPAVGALMRDPRIWPDATSYVPERWLGKYKGVEVDRKAFLPFSAGSRNCPGQQFALKEMRIILSTIVRRYEMTLIPGQSHEQRVHTVPWFVQGYYKVGLKPRVD